MPPEQRRRLIRFVFLLIVALVVAVGGNRVLGVDLGAGTVILLIVLGALIGLLVNRQR